MMFKNQIKTLLILLTVSWLGWLPLANAENADLSKLFASQSDFLDVDDAFQPSVEVVDSEIVINFKIADEYYLYREPFLFSAQGATLGAVQMRDGKKKVDEYLGNVEVYYHELQIVVPYFASQSAFTFILEYRGCAEAGLCYPPEEKSFELIAETVSSETPIGASTQQSPRIASIVTPKVEATVSGEPEFVPEQEIVVNFLTDKSLIEIVIYFLLIGIALAFTPCVLPMVPILSSIIVGQKGVTSNKKAFGLSLAYTQAMTIPYAAIGIAVGSFGGLITNTLQEPIFIVPAAIIFVLLSLAMFGFYELQLPQGLQNRLNKVSNSQAGGSYLGAAMMGAISALVVSPCVTVPLAGILVYIAQTGDKVVGGVALYSLAVGMGIPLLIVGVGGNKLLPKAGGWMNAIKASFGVIMLAMALYISKHLIPGSIYLVAWAILLIVSAVYMGALSSVESNIKKLWKGVGLVFLVYGIILLLGASLGNGSLLSPFANVFNMQVAHSEGKVQSQNPHDLFQPVKTIADVEAKISQANAQGKTVMFDFFAESCTACYEFAAVTFPDPRVTAALSNSVLIQADVTKNDTEDKALMKHFDVRGLPSILFFNTQGKEDKRLRAVGFENADIFVQRINAAFK